MAVRDREKTLGRAVTEQDLEQVTWHNVQQATKYDAGQLYRARETCDRIVSIPMVSSVESLNAGIATGVALYEVVTSAESAEATSHPGARRVKWWRRRHTD